MLVIPGPGHRLSTDMAAPKLIIYENTKKNLRNQHIWSLILFTYKSETDNEKKENRTHMKAEVSKKINRTKKGMSTYNSLAIGIDPIKPQKKKKKNGRKGRSVHTSNTPHFNTETEVFKINHLLSNV